MQGQHKSRVVSKESFDANDTQVCIMMHMHLTHQASHQAGNQCTPPHPLPRPLRPVQQAHILKAWQAFEGPFERLMQQLKELCALLAGLQTKLESLSAEQYMDTFKCDSLESADGAKRAAEGGGGGGQQGQGEAEEAGMGGGGMLLSEDNKDIALALEDNLVGGRAGAKSLCF